MFLVSFVFYAYSQQTIVWYDGFETGGGDWSVSNGTWQFGIPTSGPNIAYNGQNCAATILDGNYSQPVASRLIRNVSFIVPASSENPRFRFWYWMSFAYLDWGEVQIKTINGDWETISIVMNNYGSNAWSWGSTDISAYADSTVHLAFYFHGVDDYNSFTNDISSGWYIDDVSLVTGPYVLDNPENFELGFGDWSVDEGSWEVGIPTFGPSNSHSGQNCVGTNLEGNYQQPADSRLISPPFIVPGASENPRFRFWYWMSFEHLDWGEVQIKTINGDWETISIVMNNYGSNAWSWGSTDISAYADSTVHLAFYFHGVDDYNSFTNDISSGWYIDDVSLVTGPYVLDNPENFELGFGDWSVDEGSWEVGIPTFGPSNSHSGQNCVGTNLEGNYQQPADSRLISPPFIVPAASENPRFRFWYWISFAQVDKGEIQIKTSNGNWETISIVMNNYGSNAWSWGSIDISAYADSTVHLAFYFHGVDDYNSFTNDISSGWYIDDVSLVTGPYVLDNPENFELGFGDWSVDEGSWEVGIPTFGPSNSHSGQNCVGTNLEGNYQQPADSRLISPPFLVSTASTNPGISFQHWFSFAQADWGVVQISSDGNNWIDASEIFVNTSGGSWSPYYISLSPYANTTIQLAFNFHGIDDNNSFTNDISSGWYIDDISIEDNSGLFVDAGPDITIPFGGIEWLLPTIGGGTPPLIIQWSPPDGLDDPSSESPFASPEITTTYQIKVTDANGCFRTDNITIFVPYDLTLKTFLEGPYSETSMNTNLNSGGYLPFSQPYNQAPWNYAGSESVVSIPSPDIVDWVLIELRQTTGDASTAKFYKMVDQMAAFLLDDGSIVGLDGNSPLEFTYPITQNLFVVVWHRNHLGIMSANAVTHTGGNYTFDYSASLSNIYGGTKSCKQLSTGVWGMISGDGSSNGNINNPDKNDKWFIQSGSTGYLTGDFNMDGTVDDTDINDFWIPNAGMGTQVD